MMMVKTISAHRNGWGDAWEKAAGDCYELPEADAQVLIDAGLIEVTDGEEAEIPAVLDDDEGGES